MPAAIIGPKFYGWDNDTGKPLAFGKLHTYQSGTNTPKPTFSDETGQTKNANPVVLNAAGYADVYLQGSYKLVLKDENDNEVWTSDPVTDASQNTSQWFANIAATYVSPTRMQVSGNQTQFFEDGRAIRFNSGSGFAYAFVESTQYVNGNTLIDVFKGDTLTTALESVSPGIITSDMFGGFSAAQVAEFGFLRMDLAADAGAAMVGTSDGRTVQKYFDELDQKFTTLERADTKIKNHNEDPKAHKALTNLITQQVNIATAAADSALFSSRMFADLNTALDNTAPGDYFFIPSETDDTFATLYVNTSDVGDTTLVEVTFQADNTVIKTSAENAYDHQYTARFDVLVYGLGGGEPDGATVKLQGRKSGGSWQDLASQSFVSQSDGQPANYTNQFLTGTLTDAGANAEFRLIGEAISAQDPDIDGDVLRYFEGDPNENAYEVVKDFPSTKSFEKFIEEAAASARIYRDVAIGINATSDGDFFGVLSDIDDEYVIIYENDEDVAVERKRVPTIDALIKESQKAELAAEIAMTAGWVYATVSAGEAERLNGDYFWVISSEDNEVLNLWLMGSGGATDTGKSMPSKLLIESVIQNLSLFKSNFTSNFEYLGSGNVVPIITDSALKVLLGYDKEQSSIFGAGIVNYANFQFYADSVLGGYGKKEFVGDSRYIPFFTDSLNRIILGYDTVESVLIGAGLNQGGASFQQATESEPLDFNVSKKSINHIISYGQSLSVGAAGKPALSTQQPYSNVTFSGGPRAFDGSDYSFLPLKPLVEDDIVAPDGSTTRGETVCAGAANYATTLQAMDGNAPSDHVILASAAGHGGYRIDQLEKGSPWYNNVFMEHVNQGYASNPDSCVNYVFWVQGENDVNFRSGADYKQKLNQLVSDINADIVEVNSQATPVYLLQYQTAFKSKENPDIALAQLDVAKENALSFMVSPIYFLPHAGDNIHLNNVGYKWLGAYFGKAYSDILNGIKPRVLMPLSATQRDNVVTVKMKSSFLPLVFDTSIIGLTENNGFSVTDNGNQVGISSITTSGDKVIIELDSPPSGDCKVRYALDHTAPGVSVIDAATGNLRDSDNRTINVSGVELPLYNFAPHFELNVITLGE